MTRVAVILPHSYRGGTWRATRDLCLLLRSAGAEVVCGVIDGGYSDADLGFFRREGIPVRPFRPRIVAAAEAKVLVAQAALGSPEVDHAGEWLLADDGQGFLDARLWFVVSDRCKCPLLPLRPYVLLVFDYLQRYMPQAFGEAAWTAYREGYRETALRAWRVLATTQGTLEDERHFVGVPADRTRLLPPFCSPPVKLPAMVSERSGILWLCNSTQHKNHLVVLDGLHRYWSVGGTQDVIMAGMAVERFCARGEQGYFAEVGARIDALGSHRQRLRVQGELPDAVYWQTMASSRLLLHGAIADNGTLAAADAGLCGTPMVLSDYPQMRTLAERFAVAPRWFPADDPEALAAALLDLDHQVPICDVPATRTAIEANWQETIAALRELLTEAGDTLPPLIRGRIRHG